MKTLISSLSLIIALHVQLFAQNGGFNNFFEQTDQFLSQYVKNGKINYAAVKQSKALDQLLTFTAEANISGQNAQTIQAFYINSYNLLVIKGAVSQSPLKSVLDVNGFFDAKKYRVASRSMTLNQLEKDQLLKVYKDPRFHFVLVCGALGCPPITNFAYRPEKLETQLERQTSLALNNPEFIKVNTANQQAELSEIFKWYASDFGGTKASAVAYINRYRKTAIPASYKVSFYTYDWRLNETSGRTGAFDGADNNDNRYVVSAAIPKGTTETKWFNNLYTQQTGNGESLTDRATFFTSSLSFLYGVNNRFNAGFDLRYRRVAYGPSSASAFGVFGNPDNATTRQGFTNFGPKIRWAPFKALPNFSVQSAFWIPVGSDLEGNGELPYIDWDGASFWTQFFNDFDIGSNFSLFTEVDIFLEDIGNSAEGDLNRFSTPATVIFSYFPTPRSTVYALTNFSPFWQQDFDYFAQAGIGAKYQLSPHAEIEVLYTAFTNEFLQSVNGRASTINFGIRFSR